jgi:hypothetical protein
MWKINQHLLTLLKHSYITYDSDSVLLDRTQSSSNFTVQHQSFDIGSMQSTKPNKVTTTPLSSIATENINTSALPQYGDLIADYPANTALNDGYHSHNWQKQSMLHRHFASSQHLLFHCRFAAVQPSELVDSVLKQAEQQHEAALHDQHDDDEDQENSSAHADLHDTVVALRALSKLELQHVALNLPVAPRLFVLRNNNAYLMHGLFLPIV